jgi:hypothetical protein
MQSGGGLICCDMSSNFQDLAFMSGESAHEPQVGQTKVFHVRSEVPEYLERRFHGTPADRLQIRMRHLFDLPTHEILAQHFAICHAMSCQPEIAYLFDS